MYSGIGMSAACMRVSISLSLGRCPLLAALEKKYTRSRSSQASTLIASPRIVFIDYIYAFIQVNLPNKDMWDIAGSPHKLISSYAWEELFPYTGHGSKTTSRLLSGLQELVAVLGEAAAVWHLNGRSWYPLYLEKTGLISWIEKLGNKR